MAISTRGARQLGSILQDQLENFGSDPHGDQLAAARLGFQIEAAKALSGTGDALASDQAMTADAVGRGITGLDQLSALFDANQRGMSGAGQGFALAGLGATDFGKLQMGLGQLFLEAQLSVGGTSGAARDAALAGFQSVNMMANVRDGMVAIDAVAANGDGAALLAQLQALGLQEGGSFGRLAGGYIPIDALDEMSNLGLLAFARPVYAVTQVGNATSQDVQSLHADYAQSTYGLTGAGITIGVLSDSFNTRTTALTHYPDDVTSGDLPAGVNILQDSPAPGTDEGRGMAQVAYDIAPGVQFAFHTANAGMANFAQGIIDLKNAGAQIIVDDVRYFAESMFQDGAIAQAVDTVTAGAGGAMYFSSAGNYAQNSYESVWRDSGQTLVNGAFTYELHDFDPGAGVDTTQTILVNGTSTNPVNFIMQWDQPFASISGTGSTNDLALFFRNHTTGAIILVADADNITFDPLEFISIQTGGGTAQVDISIGKFSGADPGLVKYVTIGGGFAMSEWNTASGTSYGHSNAAGAIAVGAADWFNTPAFGQTPTLGEYFTSRGNVPILFDTAGNRLAAPEYRSTVDFTAADGGNTTFFSSDVAGDADTLPNFYGTSAAAPNAAAIAALLMERFPTATNAQIEQALKATALDITSLANNINSHTLGVATGAGYDADTGWGLIQADRAIAYLQLQLNAATQLGVGEAAIVSYETDTSAGGSPDGLRIVLLSDLAAGGTIYVTDRAWNGSSFAAPSAGEGTYAYTAASDQPAGTVITLSAAQLASGGITLSNNGETLYLYQGGQDAPTRFLFAADVADGNTTFNGNLTNTGLLNGVNAVAVAFDNATYVGAPTGIGATITTGISTANSWYGNDTDDIAGTTGFTEVTDTTVPGPFYDGNDFVILSGMPAGGQSDVVLRIGAEDDALTAQNVARLFRDNPDFHHVSDFSLDLDSGYFFFVDSDGNNVNRIMRGNVADLVSGNQNPTFTQLFATDGFGELISSMEVNHATNKVVWLDGSFTGDFEGGWEVHTINYDGTGFATVAVIDTENDTTDPGSLFGVTGVADYALRESSNILYIAASQGSVDGLGNATIHQNHIMSVNLTTGVITTLLLDNADARSINGNADYDNGRLDPQYGQIMALDVDQNTGIIYFITQPNSASGHGGVWSYDPAADDLQLLWQQPAPNADTTLQSYPTANMTGIEVDEISGRLFITTGGSTDHENDGTPATNEHDASIHVLDLSDPPGTAPTRFVRIYEPTALGAPVGMEIDYDANLTVTSSNATYTEEPGLNSAAGTPIVIFTNASITDPDQATLYGAQVAITSGFVSGDTLSFTNSGGITGSYNSTTGVVTFTGAATLAQYQTVLNSIRFTNAGDNPTNYGNDTARTVSMNVFDGLTWGDLASVTVTVVGINDAPILTATSPQAASEDVGKVITGLSVTDPDADPASQDITITLSVSHGTITIFTNAPGGVQVADVTGNGTATVTITATQNEINATFGAANGVTYLNTLDFNGSDTLHIVTNDNGHTGNDPGLTGTGTTEQDTDDVTINIAAVNDAPIVAGDGTEDSVTILEDTPSTLGQTVTTLFAGQYSDPKDDQVPNGGASSSNAFAGIAVIDNDATGATGNWEFFNGATWVVIPTSATLASATLIAAGTAIRFNPAQDYNGAEPLLTVRLVDDSAGALTSGDVVNISGISGTGGTTRYSTGSVTLSGTVTAVNDAPVHTVPGTQTVAEDATLSFAGANAISVADVDANGADVTVTVTVLHGTLAVGGNAGLTSLLGDGTGTVEIIGDVAEVNNALNGLLYTPTANYNGSDTLQITTDDGGNTGTGGAQQDVDSVTINVTPVNDTPVVSVQAAVASTEQVAGTIDAAATITDLELGALNGGAGDYGGSSLTVGRNGGAAPEDLIGFGTSGAFTVNGSNLEAGGLVFATFTGGNGANLVITFTSSGTPATQALVTAVVQSLQYTYTGDTPPASIMLDYAFDDGAPLNASQGGGGSATGTDSIIVNLTDTPENAAPVVDLDSGTGGVDYSVGFTEGDAAIPIGAGIAVTDADSGIGDLIVSAQVTLTDKQAGDDLYIEGAVPAGFNAVITNNAGSIVIDITGAGTGADYDAILAQLRYVTTSDDPTLGGTDMARTITVTVNDGTDDSAVATTTVNLTAVADAPTAQADAFTIAENGSISGGNLFADNGSGVDDDPDGPAIAISAVNGSGANVGTQITLASGALLTVNANGTFDYDPNGAFLSTPTPGSGASNTPGHDSFTYSLAGGNTVTVTISLTGLDTNDILYGAVGPDLLAGGLGNDWYLVGDASDQIVENGGEGTDRVFATVSYTLNAGAEVEIISTANHAGTAAIDLTGNEFDNFIQGNAGANLLNGDGGIDQLFGAAGDDRLYGGAGADFTYGGQGDDWHIVNNAGDVVRENVGEGNDRVFAGVSYTLTAGQEIERLSTDDHVGTAAINLTGNELANFIQGNEGANVLNGADGGDQLIGAGGNDRLYGGAGADYSFGGQGDDWHFVDNVDDTVRENAGEGNDRVFASVSYTLSAGADIELFTTDNHAGTGAINLTGNELANFIQGNEGANVLNGVDGNDQLVGAGGNDRLYGGAGADFTYGGQGDDWHFVDNAGDTVRENAGEGNDRVFASVSYTLNAGASVESISTSNNAGTGAIDLTGNELANVIQGNEGANILDGKGGADVLVGAGGADVYAFTTALGGGNVDTVSGFAHGVDQIALDDAVFGAAGPLGALNANAFVTGSAAADASDRIIYNSVTGQLYYDADGNGAGAAVQFATLSPGLTLTASDFTVI